ncbi:hypothetical protein INT48_007689 [Thamnidium elegans]|uniref:Uncharacterized protein n=1 Tax=Thamnidium elegans TaxID=101142 RepID=A0A8H7SSV8_9FUNG|nr:hypothetical protein INT48_007689 [Thamnidium elegans]
MNYVSGPKAVNIIRPSNQNKPGGIALKSHDPSKKKKSFLNLYDPKQQLPPPLLKKPLLELYNKQKLPSISNHYISEKKQQILLSEKTLLIHNKQLEDLSAINNEDARMNRKIADLEISNQSLLKINQMLETTVRQQAKQVASFKQKMMTIPNDDEQKRRETDLLLLQQQTLLENEDDWEKDEQFNRLRRMTEFLIEEAQKALEYRVEIGARVLSSSSPHIRRSSSGRRVHRRRSERNQSGSTASSSSTLNQS